MFVALKKGGEMMTGTGPKVLSEVWALSGWVLGLALKTIYPINLKAFMRQQLAFCRHHVWEETGVGGGCLCGPLTTIKEKPCKSTKLRPKVQN